MLTSPMFLKHFLVDRINFEAHPIREKEHDGEEEVNLVPTVFKNKDNKTEFAIRLEIRLNNSKEALEKRGYKMNMQLWGFFEGSKRISERSLSKYVPIGVANLYGVARGIFGQLSGISPYGSICLPTMNVYAKLPKKTNNVLKEKTTPK